MIKALYHYKPSPSLHPGELAFAKGAILHVIGREFDTDWYEACHPLRPDELGLVPVSYFEVIRKNEQKSTRSMPFRASPDGNHSGYQNNRIDNRFNSSIVAKAPEAEQHQRSSLSRLREEQRDSINSKGVTVKRVAHVNSPTPVLISAAREGGGNEASARDEASKVQGPQTDTIEAKRAQLLLGLRNAGVSRLEADQVIALYFQQQSISSPPPLPPRPAIIDGGTTTVSTSYNNTSACRILVLDDVDTPSAIIAQCYLEYLRIRTAKTGKPWLFHSLHCIGGTTKFLDDSVDWNYSETDDRSVSHRDLKSYHLANALKAMVAKLPATHNYHRSEDLVDAISWWVQLGELQPLPVDHYDYLLFFNKTEFASHQSLQSQSLSSSVRGSDLIDKRAPHPLLLPKVRVRRDKSKAKRYSYTVGPLMSALQQFLVEQLGWEGQRTFEDVCPADISLTFVSSQAPALWAKVRVDNYALIREIEERMRCRVRVGRLATNSPLMVILGPRELTPQVEALIEKLKSGGTVDLP